jgi:hypothetical protein
MSKRDYLKYLGFKTAQVVAASKTGTGMTSWEYKQLEHLLAKLQGEIGGNKICIIPHYLHDGYHIGVYSSKSGEPVTSATGPTIQETVEKLKQQSNTNDTTEGNG